MYLETGKTILYTSGCLQFFAQTAFGVQYYHRRNR